MIEKTGHGGSETDSWIDAGQGVSEVGRRNGSLKSGGSLGATGGRRNWLHIGNPGYAWSVLVLAMLLTGCVMVPASVKTSRSEVGPLRLGEDRKIAVLFSTDFSPETRGWLGEDMTECIGQALQKALPGGSVVRQKEFWEAVFPGLAPKQVLLRADTLPMLVAQPEIRQRLEQLGLHYLILVGADVRSDANFVLSSGGAGAMWDERVKMTGVLFELGLAQAVGSVTAEAAGKGAGIALLMVIPLGGGTDAIRPSCKALGSEVVRMIGGASERDGP